jgi:hypothetical protein
MATNKDWRVNVLTAVEKSEMKRRVQSTRWGLQFHIRLTPEFKTLIIAAAKRRDISLTGYIRRAVAKQVAADLGLPITEVLIHSPYPSAFGEKLPPEAYRIPVVRECRNGRLLPCAECAPDDGKGYGDWT